MSNTNTEPALWLAWNTSYTGIRFWTADPAVAAQQASTGLALPPFYSAAPALVPPGWQLVPVEPTPAMLNAANSARLYREHGSLDDADVAQRRTFNSQQAWAAMLAAAPDVPTRCQPEEPAPPACACFRGTCRGGEVINGRLANGQVCSAAAAGGV